MPLSPPIVENLQVVGANGVDLSAAGFVGRLRAESPRIILDAEGVWNFYVDDFSEYGSANDQPLTRCQLFRQLRQAGLRRFRSGAKTASGKRPYLYRLTSPGRPRRRPGRTVDGRPRNVDVRAF